ncbi:ABC transporter ATP-binding protein [Pseudoalteromonas sp. MMG012]|uniref:ABC transporter ATP-binding protein n=1 Tax=Pseudoalteromonas sp. MMG012 TaxID=2822686 RepID=UPI001B3A56B5|nr:ABC transporter ATP-binding protein [Pseudoalteromonas sp. MMG012]MBQ4851225.1 ABC transporter ATP-binding protein [Pseudoalteromonas sp. MMG012]
MIVLENLVKKFRSDDIETTALNSINLKIEKGEFVGITGQSGCGKSTLLSILGMLDAPDSGRITYAGKQIYPYKSKSNLYKYRRSVGFIFQSFNLINSLSVKDNIALPLKYIGINRKARDAKALEIMEKLDIASRSNHKPIQLSGGQQQRVAIARALVTNPDIIFADEPTGNLDSTNTEQTLELLKKINDDGTTIVMVTHDKSQVRYLSRIIQMKDGSFSKELEE